MERSKLVRWCNGVLEAGWLAVLVLAPLYMNRFTNWNIEPDKVSLVRTIAIVMIGVYLIKIAEGGRWWLSSPSVIPGGVRRSTWWKKVVRIPLFLPVALFLFAFLLSTAFSITPNFSIWGGAGRAQGLITMAAYMVIVFLLIAHLRTGSQLRRIQHAVILTTIPLAIHGLLQLLEWEPVPITGGVSRFRVEATSGNPDFLAAYFIMAVFFTAERLVTTLRGRRASNQDKSPKASQRVAVALYSTALVLQVGTIVLTQARGPWIGLSAGLFIFVLLVLFVVRIEGFRRYATFWAVGGAAIVCFMLLGNILPQFDDLRDEPYVGRLFRLLEHERGAGLARMVVWEGAVDLMTADAPVQMGHDDEDDYNPLRPIIGYGPEAFGQAVSQFVPPEYNRAMRSNEVTDRAHNETWQTLATMGLLGVFAYFAVYFAIFLWAFRWMGIFTGRSDALALLAAWLVGSVVLAAVFYVYDDGWRFLGLAVPIGMILGTTVLLYIRGVRLQESHSSNERALLLAALVAAVAAHFVESQFGIATTATTVYFWIIVALLFVIGHLGLDAAVSDDTSVSNATRRKSTSNSTMDELPRSVVVDGVIMLSLPFIYMSNLGRTEGTVSVLIESLFTKMEGGVPVFGVGMVLLMLATVAFGYLHGRITEGAAATLRSGLIYIGAMLGTWLVYGLVHAARLVPGAEGTAIDQQLGHVQGHFNVFLFFLIAWLFIAGWFAQRDTRNVRAPIARSGMRVAIAAGVLIIVSLPAVRAVAVEPVHTDVLLDLAKKCTARSDWPCTIELSRRALLVDPENEQHLMSMASGLTEQAKNAEENANGGTRIEDLDDVLALEPRAVSAASKDELLYAADVVIRFGQQINTLQPEHFANTGRLYRYWATQIASMQDRTRLLEEANRHYETAVKLRPSSASYWHERGQSLASLQRHEEAIEVLRQSLELEPTADTYVLLASELEEAGMEQEAKQVAETALAAMPNNESLKLRLANFQ